MWRFVARKLITSSSTSRSCITQIINRIRPVITTNPFLSNTRYYSTSSSYHNSVTINPKVLQYEHAVRGAIVHGARVVETPSGFPFKIEDKPGEQTITLTRKYKGDIKVIVHMPADPSSTVKEHGDELDGQNHDEHKNSVSDPQSSIRLVVSNTVSIWASYEHTLEYTLEYGVIAYPDEFSIDSFCIKYADAPDEENIYYKGPDYANLDKNLQKEFQRRVKIIGIIPSTTKFLHEYMANRVVCSSDSANLPPPPPTTTTTDHSTPESIEKTLLNDEGIPVHYSTEQYRQRGYPLVSADDIRNSGKNHKDFTWFPYPYTRSEKLLWIEVPNKDLGVSERELEPEPEIKREREREIELELERELEVKGEGRCFVGDDSPLFIDDDSYNPYKVLPNKLAGDPPIFSEEIDKIMYPELKYYADFNKEWEDHVVPLKAHNEEMTKIKYPNGRPPVVEMSDSDLEFYQVYYT